MSRIFGAVCQNGYVVRDIDAAMKHWIEVMGVGPWYYIGPFPKQEPSCGPVGNKPERGLWIHVDRMLLAGDLFESFIPKLRWDVSREDGASS